MAWYEKIVGDLSDKKRYLAYKARMKKLPAPYRSAAAGLERYLLHLGPSNDGAGLIRMLDDLGDLLAQSAADATPIRDVVGDDPVAFADTFMENYGGGSWIRSEQTRLRDAIAGAEAESSR